MSAPRTRSMRSSRSGSPGPPHDARALLAVASRTGPLVRQRRHAPTTVLRLLAEGGRSLHRVLSDPLQDALGNVATTRLLAVVARRAEQLGHEDATLPHRLLGQADLIEL